MCQLWCSVGWVISPSCTCCPFRNVLQLELELLLLLHCLRAVVHNALSISRNLWPGEGEMLPPLEWLLL